MSAWAKNLSGPIFGTFLDECWMSVSKNGHTKGLAHNHVVQEDFHGPALVMPAANSCGKVNWLYRMQTLKPAWFTLQLPP